MWPQGIEGLKSYCWDTFLDADFQRRGPNGEQTCSNSIPNETRTRTKPAQAQQHGEKSAYSVLIFHLLAVKSELEVLFHELSPLDPCPKRPINAEFVVVLRNTFFRAQKKIFEGAEYKEVFQCTSW